VKTPLRHTLAGHAALALALISPAAFAEETGLAEITVTGTREGQRLDETPAAIGIVGRDAIRLTKPSHPAQILNQVPGAAAAVTNGEGHSTAIRQPFTTAPVYLFLEDGIPIRSTGFFNHNALYEINLPQAGGIEINRGATTALYGSDAIGGAVNVLTEAPPQGAEFRLFGEAGGFGWKRLLATGGNAEGDEAWRLNGNLTRTDGWRSKTAYDRKSFGARWDHAVDASTVIKTVLSSSDIDQQTGANSPLTEDDYKNNPTLNYKPIAFRRVSALRLSAAIEREVGDTLISLTPYFRNNSMDLLASFKLTSGTTGDNTIAYSSNRSYGLLAKWRRDFADYWKARLIVGVDIDHSPGERHEDHINATVTGAGASRNYTSYTVDTRVYDYAVTYSGISPYIHGEISPLDALRISAGLRQDHVGFTVKNHISSSSVSTGAGNPIYGQASDGTVRYRHLSPKLGATLALDERTHLFTSYNHSFRAPSESDLFRPSTDTNAARAVLAAQSAATLKPVKADQYELGLRGRAAGISYDFVRYDLTKKDDIFTYTDPVTNVRSSSNNGSTRHRGFEAAVGMPLGADLRADVAYSQARHKYVQWTIPNGGANRDGYEMASAPRTIANSRLTWNPAPGTLVQLEWVHLSSYWRDDAHSLEYNGHELFNLRGELPLGKDMSLSARINNLSDRRYADSASMSSGVPVSSPGLPRTLYVGLEAKW
jgi:outer membrane receptor protein involved in Fe transport